MTMTSHTVTVWESGRLVAAPPAPSQMPRFRREQWIGGALLVACALLMTLYVCVLERDVNRAALQRDEMRAREVAEGACESTRAADGRGACLAILRGDAVASARGTPDADPAPPNDVYAADGHMATASLGAATGLAGIAQ